MAFRNLGIPPARVRSVLMDEEAAELVPRYLAGESGAKLCEARGVWFTALYNWMHEHGIPVRGRGTHVRSRHPVREGAFDAVTPEAAYWIGFLMADGSISDDGVLALGLAEADAAHVEAFRVFLGASNPVHTYTHRGGFKPGARLAEFRVQSPRLAEALARHGVTPRKQTRQRALWLGDDPDFWRGVMDGDGCIYAGRAPAVILCGSYGLMEQFKDFVDRHLPGGEPRQIEARGGIHYHTVGGKRGRRLARLLYDRPGPALQRKRALALTIPSY